MAEQSNAEENQEEQELQRQLSELRVTLAQFHDEVRADPAVWHDPQAVGTACGTVRLTGSVEQNLQGLWLREMRRQQARAATTDSGAGAAEERIDILTMWAHHDAGSFVITLTRWRAALWPKEGNRWGIPR